MHTPAQERVLRLLFDARRRLEREGTSLWSIRSHADRRRRPLALLSDRETMRLLEDGALTWADVQGLVLSDAERNGRSVLPADPRAWMAAGLPRAKAPGESFVTLALLARQGKPSAISLRQAAAGLRLASDAEQAATSAGLSMNWDAVPQSRCTRSGGAPPTAGAQARAKLARLEGALGQDRFALLSAACIDGRTLRWIERRFGFAKTRGGHALAKALEQLADIYDGRGKAATAAHSKPLS